MFTFYIFTFWIKAYWCSINCKRCFHVSFDIHVYPWNNSNQNGGIIHLSSSKLLIFLCYPSFRAHPTMLPHRSVFYISLIFKTFLDKWDHVECALFIWLLTFEIPCLMLSGVVLHRYTTSFTSYWIVWLSGLGILRIIW